MSLSCRHRRSRRHVVVVVVIVVVVVMGTATDVLVQQSRVRDLRLTPNSTLLLHRDSPVLSGPVPGPGPDPGPDRTGPGPDRTRGQDQGILLETQYTLVYWVSNILAFQYTPRSGPGSRTRVRGRTRVRDPGPGLIGFPIYWVSNILGFQYTGVPIS